MERDGDGIDDTYDDRTEMTFHHGFGWVDTDGDSVNAVFVDADRDGISGRTGHGYSGGCGHTG